MTAADKLNLVGIIITGFGSCLGMVGVFKQTNGYYAFKSTQIFEHLARLLRTRIKQGRAAAIAQINATAALARQKGEDHTQSLIGLYCVLFGFFLQLFGSFVLLSALFADSGRPPH
jgi:hypothetical protein